jgi:hypothetical protein
MMNKPGARKQEDGIGRLTFACRIRHRIDRFVSYNHCRRATAIQIDGRDRSELEEHFSELDERQTNAPFRLSSIDGYEQQGPILSHAHRRSWVARQEEHPRDGLGFGIFHPFSIEKKKWAAAQNESRFVPLIRRDI